MNANWVKNQSDEKILKQIAEQFKNDKYEIDFFIKSDDGGKHIEAKVVGQHFASELRKKIPINFCGWRTIVAFTPLEVILKKKD